jgi:hypothetical protein
LSALLLSAATTSHQGAREQASRLLHTNSGRLYVNLKK